MEKLFATYKALVIEHLQKALVEAEQLSLDDRQPFFDTRHEINLAGYPLRHINDLLDVHHNDLEAWGPCPNDEPGLITDFVWPPINHEVQNNG